MTTNRSRLAGVGLALVLAPLAVACGGTTIEQGSGTETSAVEAPTASPSAVSTTGVPTVIATTDELPAPETPATTPVSATPAPPPDPG